MKATVMSIIVVVLVAIFKNLEKKLGELKIQERIETVHVTSRLKLKSPVDIKRFAIIPTSLKTTSY